MSKIYKYLGKDEYEPTYLGTWHGNFARWLINSQLKKHQGENEVLSDREDLEISDLTNLLEIYADKNKLLYFITNHLSTQDVPFPQVYLFENGFHKNLPLTLGGNNLSFPLITKDVNIQLPFSEKKITIPALGDLKKSGMLSINRMNNSNGREIINELSDAISHHLSEGRNMRTYLTNGRIRDGTENGKSPAAILRWLPTIIADLKVKYPQKEVLIQPEIITYEAGAMGAWTFKFQDWMKKENHPTFVKNSAILLDAIALLYHRAFENKGKISIEYGKPISITRDTNGKEFYKIIADEINSKVKISSVNIVAHILRKNDQTKPFSYNKLVQECERYKDIISIEDLPAFLNVKSLEPDSLADRGIMFLSQGFFNPAVKSKGLGYKINPKSKMNDYHANRLNRYEKLFK